MQRIVWGVYDNSMHLVEHYPFKERVKAEQRALELTAEAEQRQPTRTTHIVQALKIFATQESIDKLKGINNEVASRCD